MNANGAGASIFIHNRFGTPALTVCPEWWGNSALGAHVLKVFVCPRLRGRINKQFSLVTWICQCFSSAFPLPCSLENLTPLIFSCLVCCQGWLVIQTFFAFLSRYLLVTHTHWDSLRFFPHKSVDRLPFVSAVASGVLSLYCNWEKDQVTHCFTSLSIINRVIVPISLSYLLSDFVNCLWGAAPWWQKQTLQFDIAV